MTLKNLARNVHDLDAARARLPKPLMVSPERAAELREEALHLLSWDLHDHQLWDLELLLNGAFSPLTGYLNKADYESVCANMRLSDGSLWPMPVTLDVPEAFAADVKSGDRVALRHPEGMVLAIITVEDAWMPDLEHEASSVLGTTDEAHPAVFQLRHDTEPYYIGGCVEGIEMPPHHTFEHLRYTPLELRAQMRKLGWNRVVAFQTHDPMHRAQVELTRRAAERAEANLLLHPVLGRTGPGDVDYFSRVRCYDEVMKQYPAGLAMLSLLPLAMRMGGPREALWHCLIRRNYGCTHLVIGQEHAGPGKNSQGEPFYDPYAAQALVREHQDEIGIEAIEVQELVYCEDLGQYVTRGEVPEGGKLLDLSGTELRRRLLEGADVPEWFSYPDVIDQLRQRYPSRDRQGFTVFLTGLSGSGKSTIANILMPKLMELGERPVTLLDGDIVRKNLSSELGFSKEHRDLNVTRIGYVASEITKNRGVAICAPIAPYTRTRRQVRETVSQYGGFVEVHVATPLETCEQRDRKGLYAKARAGLIKEFTGIDDPYEAPENAELVIDTRAMSAEDAARKIVLYLANEGYLIPSGNG